ncbi:MAG: hypothetical protein COA96_06860 [SAR86 cluster bacterium]|uniref:Protein TonB n=1 Tax=SAR86 cluster bacterium TaxID=2030880 RepID=A0A2A5B325_9GAMM|nr:MAG: hypothetical protein COA96_06860 [SAR86 cluster bacterium]
MQAIPYRLFKYNSVVLTAALITFLLFYFMQFLISSEEGRLRIVNVIKVVDATVPEFKDILFIDEPKPEPVIQDKPLEEDNLPRNPDSVFGLNINPGFIPVPAVEPPLIGLTLSNNIMVPLIRTMASYPNRALQNGIEGFVELSFTVNKLGNVEDPVVINAQPPGTFERSALRAIRKWKYSPAVEEGEPVPSYDVRQRIVFQIDPSSL